MRLFGALAVLVSIPAAAQNPTDLLAQIRQRMAENLSHLPNYTCRETIERTVRLAGSKHFQLADRLRLDVAYVGNRELYAWPGAEKFEDAPIAEIVQGGAIGDGSFGGFAREIFSANVAKFSWAGEETREGRRMVRFDFRVSVEDSRYKVQHGDAQAVVAYRGSFEADAGTLLPSRLEVEADGIPAELKLRLAGQVMQYGEMRIGDSTFLLPLASELRIEESAGQESRNSTKFAACRQYSGESIVHFDVVDGEGASAAALAPIELPPSVSIEGRLREMIDNATAARGDVVHLTVASDVKRSGRVIVPKGAVLTGRITGIETQSWRSAVYFGVGLTFHMIEFAGRRGAFSGQVDDAGVGANYSVSKGVVFIKGNSARLPEGTRMSVRTR